MTIFREQPELLVPFKAGDEKVLTKIFQWSAPRLKGFFKGRGVGSWFDVEILVTETLEHAFRPQAREAYDGARVFWNWIAEIGRNVLFDHRAKEKWRAHVDSLEGDDWDDQPGVPTISPLEIERLQVRWEASQYVEMLPDSDRRFVVLRFIEERPQEDVAGLLDVGRRQVRTQEAAILKGLRKHLRMKGLTP